MAKQQQYYIKNAKIAIPITIRTFESVLNYLLTLKTVNRKFVRNIQKILEIIDTHPYESDDYQMFILNAIQLISELRIKGINNAAYIRDSFMQSDLDSGFVSGFLKNLDKHKDDLTKEEYDNLSLVIRDFADYTFVYQARPLIMEMYDQLISANGKLSTVSMNGLKEQLELVLLNMRMADISRDEEKSICFDPAINPNIGNEIAELYDDITDPSNIFVTGLKELNRFLNGGYRRRKMYIYYAPTNSFKSGILLYNTLWLVKFNPLVTRKYPNKKLCILYLTAENTVAESMERIHAIFTEGMVDPASIPKDMFVGQFTDILANLNTNFRMYMRYISPGTTPEIIKSIVQEYEEDEDNEIVAVVLDHLGNMMPSVKSNDTRTGLINVAYELSDWVKRTNRILITAMHTNSEFDNTLKDAIECGKNNLVRMCGRHCIADAKYIDRAVDQSIFMVKEYSNFDGQWYLGFKYEKIRSKRSQGSNIFFHKLDNEITLRYDYGTPACFSTPCIPGTGNSFQNGCNQPGLQQNGMPFGQASPQATDPFANKSQPKTSMMGGGRRPPPVIPQIEAAINAPAMPVEYGVQSYDTHIQPLEIDDVEFVEDDFTVANAAVEQLINEDPNDKSDPFMIQDDEDDVFEDDFEDFDDFNEFLIGDGGDAEDNIQTQPDS